ncbi:metallophosphoesterase [Flavisolibacter nicotianae]|uniref:metallophosphoesterase n=1 Tax=Flavisolibacter nicotianae TaxID=2364882 RepID=UPI000EB389CA|nr:metallophosphoesterase [Flavisolibacter nicotianae]
MNPSKTTGESTQPVMVDTKGRKVYVLSDLHMAAGLNTDGNYEGTENFYADQSFVRFLDHLQQQADGKGALLVINGDFIDFLRICTIPETPDDFRCWKEVLEQVGIQKELAELESSILPKEKEFGLKTHDYKSVWKLYCCIRGHKAFFRRLARWVADGNELLVVQGNHDLEWHWPAVQAYLRVALERYCVEGGAGETVCRSMKARIRFFDDSLVLDGRVYIEHGHRYEKITFPVGGPVLNNGTELNLPFGSFINRYLINQFELSYPFLDNVRPTPNILNVLLKENFGKALRVITWELPAALRRIPGQYIKYSLQYLVPLLLLVLLPVAAAITTYFRLNRSKGQTLPFVEGLTIEHLLLCALVYFLTHLLGRFFLSLLLKREPPFSEEAKRILKDNPTLDAVLFGHTHDPEQTTPFADGENAGTKKQRYFNTGTWIPVFETSSADVRFDKTYTFITIDLTEKDPCKERLQRWNDDAGRVDPMLLNDKKKKK